MARELCDDLLKAKLYDEKVKLITGNSNETVKRKDVFIKLRDEEEAKPLEPQGELDEYTLKPEQVENVVLAGEVREPPAGGVSPLQGTPYSDAIKDFNTQRDQIKQWSEVELTSLRDSCLLKKPVLDGGGGTGSGGPTLILRIEGLIKIVAKILVSLPKVVSEFDRASSQPVVRRFFPSNASKPEELRMPSGKYVQSASRAIRRASSFCSINRTR